MYAKLIHRAHIVEVNVSKFIARAGKFLSATDPIGYNLLLSQIDIIKSITVPSQLSSLADFNTVYAKLAQLEHAIDTVCSVYSDADLIKKLTIGMSSTFAQEIFRERNFALDAQEQFKSMLADDNFNAPREIAQKSTTDDLFNFLIGATTINGFIVWLTSYTITRTDGIKKQRLEQMVQQFIDQTLGVTRLKLESPGIDGNWLRYGLAPLGDSMSADDLSNIIGGAINSPRSNNIPGVILCCSVTPSPVEFSMRGLIDLEYVTIHDLKTLPIAGVNKKVIERMNTAKMLERANSSPLPVQVYPGKPDNWYIIETINMQQYRLLGNHQQTIHSTAAIRGLIDGMTSRPEMYNRLQSDSILSVAHDSTLQLKLAAYTAMTPLSSEIAREKMLDDLSDDFTRRIANMKSIEHMLDAVINPTLITQLLSNRPQETDPEIMLTSYAHADGTVYKFTRELNQAWESWVNNASSTMFTEYEGKNLQHLLVTIFREVTKPIIDGLDSLSEEISLKEFILKNK